ncbi:hypothetical protein EV175_001033 [Coemansia sp. RSA 1933]|nr:hypothetical protein EV175_001033 [Coemansia sp. RSA 1933]
MSYGRLLQFDRALFGASDASVDMDSLVRLCFSGIPEVNGLRGLCWQVLLGYLPPDRRTWTQVLRSRRRAYVQLVEEIADSVDGTGSKAQSLLDQIRADIQRTMPDIAALRNQVDGANENNSNDEDDDGRCNTIVSDLTALSMESADSCATIAPGAIQQQQKQWGRRRSSAVLSAGYVEESNSSSPCSGINRLRRSLGEKVAAATAAEDGKTEAIVQGGGRQTSGGKLKRWLQSQPQTHAEALARILFVHGQFNKGVGYVQGMNELLAPLYYVLISGRCATGAQAMAASEADAFHLFILAMRGEHMDMFVSALDTAPSSPQAEHQQRSISEQELQFHHQRAVAAAKAHGSAIALPVAACGERNKQRRGNAACRNGAGCETGSETGGLQRIIRHWWESSVRTADVQLWSRLEALGVHPEHFAVRWLLVWGAREFALPDVLVLWDSLMANRARLAAHADDSEMEQTNAREVSGSAEAGGSAMCLNISQAITWPATEAALGRNGGFSAPAQERQSGEFSAMRTGIGRLQCEVRARRGVSGDDGDRSQLGFLFDFFTAVLVAMRGWLLASPFEKCISLLQQLPRDVPELDMHALLDAALRRRSERADSRAAKACRAVLSTVDRTALGLAAAAGADDLRGLEALDALYGPSISRQVLGDAGPGTRSAAIAGGGKVSRFFGQLSGRIGQTMQTLFNDADGSSPAEVDCLLLVQPVPRSSPAAVAVYEVAHFDSHTLVATVVSLGECDASHPSLASVRCAAAPDSSAPPVVTVRLPAPYAAAHIRKNSRDGGRLVRGPTHRSTPNFGMEQKQLRAEGNRPEKPWWAANDDAAAHRNPLAAPVRIELCDYDSDSDIY